MTDFRMPSLGADMEAGTLVEWLVKPGDTVKRGDVVAVVETQKGAIEIEIFHDGVVSELAVPVGQLVPVGTVLARLDGEVAAAAAGCAADTCTEPLPLRRRNRWLRRSPPAPSGRVQVSPAARRLAAERGVDIQQLKGTGPGGAISVADVEAAKPAPTPETPRRRTGFDPAAMRQAIAAAMSRSKREIPHYYLSQTVEVSRRARTSGTVEQGPFAARARAARGTVPACHRAGDDEAAGAERLLGRRAVPSG